MRPFISNATVARRLGLSGPALYRQIKLGFIPTNERGKSFALPLTRGAARDVIDRKGA
jgi:hypothetical protein